MLPAVVAVGHLLSQPSGQLGAVLVLLDRQPNCEQRILNRRDWLVDASVLLYVIHIIMCVARIVSGVKCHYLTTLTYPIGCRETEELLSTHIVWLLNYFL